MLACHANEEAVTLLSHELRTSHLFIRTKNLLDAHIHMLIIIRRRIFLLNKIFLSLWGRFPSRFGGARRPSLHLHLLMISRHFPTNCIWHSTCVLLMLKISIKFNHGVSTSGVTYNTAVELILYMFIKHIVSSPLLSILHF